jgi:hypothetical protein
MVRLLTSVEQRESVLHEKRTTSRPLRPGKSNSKSLNAQPVVSACRAERASPLFLYVPFLASISKETISDSDEEME